MVKQCLPGQLVKYKNNNSIRHNIHANSDTYLFVTIIIIYTSMNKSTYYHMPKYKVPLSNNHVLKAMLLIIYIFENKRAFVKSFCEANV